MLNNFKLWTICVIGTQLCAANMCFVLSKKFTLLKFWIPTSQILGPPLLIGDHMLLCSRLCKWRPLHPVVIVVASIRKHKEMPSENIVLVFRCEPVGSSFAVNRPAAQAKPGIPLTHPIGTRTRSRIPIDLLGVPFFLRVLLFLFLWSSWRDHTRSIMARLSWVRRAGAGGNRRDPGPVS